MFLSRGDRVKKLEEAYNFVRETSANGGNILFVGTKKQAQDAIREEAIRCGASRYGRLLQPCNGKTVRLDGRQR